MSIILGSLSIRSILLTAGVIGFVGCVLLIRSGDVPARHRAPSIPGVWPAAAFIQTLSAFAHAFRDQVPSWIVFSLMNALMLFAFGLLWLGACRLRDREAPLWLAAVPPGIWLASRLIPVLDASPLLRSMFFVAMTSGLFVMTAQRLRLLQQQEGLSSARDFAVAILLVMCWLVGIVIYSTIEPPASENWGFVRPATALLIAVFSATLPLLMLSVARERALRREAELQAQALNAGRAEIARLHAKLPAVIFLAGVAKEGTSRLLYRGGDLAEVTGWPPIETKEVRLVHSPDPHAFPLDEALPAVLRDGCVTSEWRLPQPDGAVRHMRTSFRVISTMEDGAAEVVGYTLDATTEREAQASVVATARLSSLGEMARGLAHEIKQPLQALSLGAELAVLSLQNNDTLGATQRLEAITEQAQREADVVEHLRRFVGDSDAAIPLAPVAVAAVVEAALRLTHHSLDRAGVELLVLVDHPLPMIQVQEASLTQVLVHLIANARDALAEQPAGATRRLTITATMTHAKWVDIEVADTGGGISVDVLPRLFEPFVTTKQPGRGAGVGLATCRSLVNAMNGTIAIRNDAAGAVVVLRIPAIDVSETAPG